MAERRKTIKFLWLPLLSITCLLTSCLPGPLEVKTIPKLDPRIVVSTQIVTNQSIIVFLTKSIGALDAGKDSDIQNLVNQISVDDATVVIKYTNTVDTLTNLGGGLYTSITTTIVAGETYTLEVNSPSMGKISSITKAQEAVPFQDVKATLYKGEDDSLAQVDYSLQDPAPKNFYMVNVQGVSQVQGLSSLLNPRVFTHVMTDEEFNGTLFHDEIKVFFQSFSKGDTVVVSLTNISEDYYAYVKKRVDNRFDLTSFATEPFNYPTNIKGGYGYFNIQQPDIRIFTLE